MKLKLWVGKAYFDPVLFARTGKSLDSLACPKYSSGACRCKRKCIVCGHGMHASYHGPIYRQPVGSMPWGHEFAEGIEPDELPALLPAVQRALSSVPEEMKDDVRQDIILSLLTHGAPLDLHARVEEKVHEWFRQQSRHKMLSLDEPMCDGSGDTFADRLIG